MCSSSATLHHSSTPTCPVCDFNSSPPAVLPTGQQSTLHRLMASNEPPSSLELSCFSAELESAGKSILTLSEQIQSTRAVLDKMVEKQSQLEELEKQRSAAEADFRDAQENVSAAEDRLKAIRQEALEGRFNSFNLAHFNFGRTMKHKKDQSNRSYDRNYSSGQTWILT